LREKEMEFQKDDRIIVVRNVARTGEEKINSFGIRTDYPRIGWKGTLIQKSGSSSQWEIKWDGGTTIIGDLIYEWMMTKIQKGAKMKVGDKVRVVSHNYYSTYDEMAEKMKATKWIYGTSVNIGEIGVIKCIKSHPRKADGKLALVDFGNKEIIMSVDRGLMKYNPNDFFSGDIVLIIKKVKKQRNWNGFWNTHMDKTINRLAKVEYNDGSEGILLRIRGNPNRFHYPSKALEKISKEEVY